MPSGTSRGIAEGIEKGVNNFLQTYMAVKQHKSQEKYRKLAPVLSVIQSQIGDPNVPLDQKIAAVDSIPHLLGSFKTGDVPLSQHFGLDKLSQEMLDTGDKETTTKGVPSQTITDQSAVDFNTQQNQTQGQTSGDNLDGTIPQSRSLMATSIQTRPIQTVKKSIMKRRGEMSDADVQLLKQKSLFREQQASQFERQYQLNIQQAELQSNVLAKQGWKNNDDWNLDEKADQWQQSWFNPITKESYTQKLPQGVVPISVIQKQIQYSGANKTGVSKAYSTLEYSIATSMGLDQDDPRVKLATANVWKQNFEAGVDYKKQGVEGSRKIQPGQKESLGIATEHLDIAKNKIKSDYEASIADVISLEERKSNQHQLVADKKEILKHMVEDDGYSVDDPEYLKADAVYRAELVKANTLETEYNKALRTRDSLKGQADRLGSDGSGTGFSPRMQVRIKVFRDRNKAKLEQTPMTDDQIAEILAAKFGKE